MTTEVIEIETISDVMATIKLKPRKSRLKREMPEKQQKALVHRTVDKGTIYEREVFIDPNTLNGAQDELEAIISKHLSDRQARARPTGKTARKRKNGYQTRRAGRRSAHESWMHAVKSNPAKPEPHPFHSKVA